MKTLFLAFFSLTLIFTAGCRSLLPRGEETTKSKFKSYDEAEIALMEVFPNKTTIKDLAYLGLGPEDSNVKKLNYKECLDLFIYNVSAIDKEDLPEAIQTVIKEKENCYGLEITLNKLDKQRVGNFWSDFFSFKKVKRIEGWNFKALIVLHNDIVIYKLTSGTRNISKLDSEKTPLGVFQNAGEDILKEGAKALIP